MNVMVFAYQSIGHRALSYLTEHHRPVVAVVTHKDQPGEKIWFPSVADLARSHGVPIYYAEDLDGESLTELTRRVQPEMILSFYYRNVLPMKLLQIAPRGGLNLHGSLLPKYRGRAPANWVLVHDEKKTGVTLHEMVQKPDAGPIVAQREISIEPRETIRTLYEKMIHETGRLLEEWYPRIESGNYPRVVQDERQASVFGGRRAEDGRIDWKWSSRRVDCLVRAVTDPYPGAFTTCQDRKLVIWEGEPIPGRNRPPGTVVLDEGTPVISTSDGEYRVDRYTYEGSESPISFSGAIRCAF